MHQPMDPLYSPMGYPVQAGPYQRSSAGFSPQSQASAELYEGTVPEQSEMPMSEREIAHEARLKVSLMFEEAYRGD